MKFVDTYRLSPVINCGDLPWEEDYFHMKPELVTKDFIKSGNYDIDEAWWKKQKERCLYGYTIPNAVVRGGDAIKDGVDAIWDGNDVYLSDYDLWLRNGDLTISGRMYFYLNFWWIFGLDQALKIKNLIRPRFFDADFLFAERVELMRKLDKDDAEPKARQKGFSEKIGMTIGWNYTFWKNSVNIIVGGTEDDAAHTMDNVKRGLEMLRNTQFYKIRLGKSDGIDQLKKWKAKHFGSEIHQLSAKDNLQVINRFSPTWIHWEEVGKWKRGAVLATKEFALPAMQAEGYKTGWNQYIGTGGDMEGGAYDLEQLAYDPDKFNALSFRNKFEKEQTDSRSSWFTSDLWMVITDKDGNSDFEKSRQKIEADYAKKSLADKYKYKTQHPIFLEDCFYSSDDGYFGKDIIMKLIARKHFLRTHREARMKRVGRLEWINTAKPFEGVRFVPDEVGWFMMSEEPEMDRNGSPILNLYNVATDSYDQDEAVESTSKGACWVWKRFYDAGRTYKKWVAGIIERPTPEQGGAEKFYEHTAMMCIFYNMSLNLVEYSKILILSWYKNNGLESLLKARPDIATAAMMVNSNAKNKYGIDPSTKAHWLSSLRDTLTEEVINQMDFEEQIDAFIRFKYVPGGDQRKFNCDITIASALTIVADKDDIGISAATIREIEERNMQRPMRFVERNGQLVRLMA